MNRLKPLEHGFKDLFFTICKGLLRRGQAELNSVDGNSIGKVLFLRPEKIGDMVISFPAFDTLNKKYPHIKMAVLGSPRNFEIIKDDPRFYRVFLYRKHLVKDLREIKAMRCEKFDCVLDMIDGDSVTTLFLSQFLAPGSRRIGIGKTKHGRYYDFNYGHPDGVGNHIIDNTLKLLVPFGIDDKDAVRFAPPHITARTSEKTGRFLSSLGGNEGGMTVGFNLSAGRPTRIWPREKARQLSQRLLEFLDSGRLILITAPADRHRGERLLSELRGSVSLVPPDLSLLDVSALISRLDLLISPDTSLIHIARSFRVPVIGLYSRARKNFRRWQPFEQPDGAVVSGNDDNIFDITVDQVFDRIVQVIGREKPAIR